MELDQKTILRKALPLNKKLERLYKQHQQLDDVIAKVSRRRFLTAREESALKQMKIRKLSALEQMLEMVALAKYA
jgi:uncharacterized protein YdcH (DUF465 family)